MNILLLGSGGREHALAWKLHQSKSLTLLVIAPGNPGMASLGTCVNININDFEAVKKTVLQYAIDLVVVGPEEPLVRGIYDYFKSEVALKNVAIVAPSKLGAALEGSKDFAKQFMMRHRIPTARYQSFTKARLREGCEFLSSLPSPYVLKADGLAAGKGVLILNSLDEAKTQLEQMLNGKFGEAGNTVVIEEFLSGIELSVFVLTDGKSYKLLPEAKDYKRIGEGDTGLNTGGMGSISPVPFATPEFMEKVTAQIIRPTMEGLQAENIDYRGFIFFGLIKVGQNPYVIEYNVRMGDPETESVMLRLDADLADLLLGAATQTLEQKQCKIFPEAAASVVCVSGGYPQEFPKGFEISGIETVTESIIFQAGTKKENNKLLTAGGRVLVASSTGENLPAALQKSYQSIQQIDYQGKYCRGDIGGDVGGILGEMWGSREGEKEIRR